MKVALIGDIHANLLAFNLALLDMQKERPDKIIFLGDYITDGINSNEILELVQKNASYAILGNREKYILNFNNEQKDYLDIKSITYTYNELSIKSFNYLNSLENHLIINLDKRKILIIHGDEYGHNSDTLEKLFDEYLNKYDFDICIFGHTHKHICKWYKNKLFINPGSIGIPKDDASYKYAILDTTNLEVTFKCFPVADTFTQFLENYQNSNYYKENYIWGTLVLAEIKSGKDYTTPFIKEVRAKIKNYENISPKEFNLIWQSVWQDYQKKLPKIK